MAIHLARTGDTIELSGDTYSHRGVLRAKGAKWHANDKKWSLPADCEGWAVSLLGAIPDDRQRVVERVIERAAAPEIDSEGLCNLVDQTVARELGGVLDVMQALKKQVEAAEARLDKARVTKIEVVRDGKAHKVEGLAHEMLPTLITSLAAGLHVWIAGPSGSGKTHGAEQAAKALGLGFELQGAMTMAHELIGFVDAGGKYHETPFTRAFRNGGLVLLDELDAGSNEALLALNAALANGLMSLPSGEVISAHADFKCIGSANTFGNGATAEYVGRTRIDAAFLQRFGARLTWDYDERLELAMSGNDAWVKQVQKARREAAKHGLKVMITPRASQAGAKLIAAGMTFEQAANLTYLAGLTPAQRAQLGA